MRLRRGFKSEANSIAREVRDEIGLGIAAPLDPVVLAAFLEIPVAVLSDFRGEVPDAVTRLIGKDRGAFSAATVFDGQRCLIVMNDAHAEGRQASDLAHEIAHRLLLHEPAPAFARDGTRRWNPEQEAEAEFLAGALLISEEAALRIVWAGWSDAEAARRYNGSVPMVAYRLNVTGARTRVARTRARRAKGRG